MKISFCITCKNRLFHLSQTLPFNILNSLSYDKIEFVVLDYNSEDGLLNWARKHLFYWQEKGIVKYIRTESPKKFCPAHAKNLAHKNATGDVLCNLDADNFLSPGFCEYLAKIFLNEKVFYFTHSEDSFGNHGCCGKIAVHSKHFYSVNGYDEEGDLVSGWGWDDINFKVRVREQNNLNGICGDLSQNIVIAHSNQIRTRDFDRKDLLNTRNISISRIMEILKNKDYIANKGKSWGFIEDLKVGLFS